MAIAVSHNSATISVTETSTSFSLWMLFKTRSFLTYWDLALGLSFLATIDIRLDLSKKQFPQICWVPTALVADWFITFPGQFFIGKSRQSESACDKVACGMKASGRIRNERRMRVSNISRVLVADGGRKGADEFPDIPPSKNRVDRNSMG